MNALAAIPAIACVPLAWAVAAREPGYRRVAALLSVLGGLACLWVCVEPQGPLQAGAARPYVGLHRWAWALGAAVVIAGAVVRAAVAWMGTRRTSDEGRGDRGGASVYVEDSGRHPGMGTRNWLRRHAIWKKVQVQAGGAGSSPGAASCCIAYVGGSVAVAVALFRAYPHVRGIGGPWDRGSTLLLRASAAAQVLAGAWWAAREHSKPPAASLGAWWATVSISARVALLFSIGGAWDLRGTLAPWVAIREAWWITVAGNWIFYAAICAVQVAAVVRMRRDAR